jgi:hypothetical protein
MPSSSDPLSLVRPTKYTSVYQDYCEVYEATKHTMIANSTLAASCAALSSAIIQVFILNNEEKLDNHG